MAVVDLTALPIAYALPAPFSQARAQQPTYGSGFILDRPGTRWQFAFASPLMRVEPDWRTYSALFDDAERLGALCAIPQPGFNPGNPGLTLVDGATASGRVVPVTGGTAYYPFRIGQWISIVVDGQRYADRIAEQSVLDATGEGEIRLRNLLRVPLAGAEVIEVGEPKVEGIIEITSRPPLEPRQMAAIEFMLTEVR
jgi:hypothetical protein